MNKYKLLATVGLFLGLLSLTSLIAYGVSGSFWWVETTRQDGERAVILFLMHLLPWISGVAGFAYLFSEWEPE